MSSPFGTQGFYRNPGLELVLKKELWDKLAIALIVSSLVIPVIGLIAWLSVEQQICGFVGFNCELNPTGTNPLVMVMVLAVYFAALGVFAELKSR